jgi:hypothetical protein
VGDVLAGRVEQGEVKPGDEVIFLPTHTAANPCVGKVFTVEMHHKRVEKAGPGDNVGMNIKGLDKGNMPRSGVLFSEAGGGCFSGLQIESLDILPAVTARLCCSFFFCRVTCIEQSKRLAWNTHGLLHMKFLSYEARSLSITKFYDSVSA